MACKYVYDLTEKLQPPFCHKTYVKSRKNKENKLPAKSTCVCKHLFITCPAVFSKMEYTLCYYEPENKAQSRQLVGPGSPGAEKLKTQPPAATVMATVFWDAKGVIMLDILPKRSTITGVYYANLLDQLRTAIREKRRGKLSKSVLLQQDNTRVHTCKVAMDAVERNGYEL